MKKVIAIVEDEPAIRDNYAAAFQRHGYCVRTYGTRKEAIEAFRARLPDLAVIDVGLRDEPEGGFELCRELRSMSAELPIIFLTARDSELDAVSGLRLGADDYLTKDLSLTHLIARVTALFRRIDALTQPSNRDQIVARGALMIDAARLHATWQEQPLGLTLTEFWIVHALAKNPGHVKNRQQLMDAANVVLDDNTITSHIKRIRRKFQAIEPVFDNIETMYGMGYRWKEDAEHVVTCRASLSLSMSLRTKLLLLSLLTLILPWAGWQYAQQMETTLRSGQEAGTAHDRGSAQSRRRQRT